MFSSSRERRLWAAAAVVVVATYSTLGLANTMSEELRRRSLFDALFGVALVVLLAGLVATARRTRVGGREIGLALGLAAVWLTAAARMAIPEERTHLIEYALLAGLVQQALAERRRNGRFGGRPGWAAFAVAGVVGIIDELIQATIPSRVFDARDIGFNLFAAAFGATTMSLLTRGRGGVATRTGPGPEPGAHLDCVGRGRIRRTRWRTPG